MSEQNNTPIAGIKADVIQRLLAKSVDVGMFIALVLALGLIGALLGLAYLALADVIWPGQSVGKKLMRVRVTSLAPLGEISYQQSMLRNTPIVFLALLGIIPLVGWMLFATMGLVVVAVETFMMIDEKQGRRLGDHIADTMVIEAPVVVRPSDDATN